MKLANAFHASPDMQSHIMEFRRICQRNAQWISARFHDDIFCREAGR